MISSIKSDLRIKRKISHWEEKIWKFCPLNQSITKNKVKSLWLQTASNLKLIWKGAGKKEMCLKILNWFILTNIKMFWKKTRFCKIRTSGKVLHLNFNLRKIKQIENLCRLLKEDIWFSSWGVSEIRRLRIYTIKKWYNFKTRFQNHKC